MSKINENTLTHYDKTPVVTFKPNSTSVLDNSAPLKTHGGYESEKNEAEEVTWDTFTRNTTFHGVKYIFDESPYRFRR